MREKAEEALTEFGNCPYGMLRLTKGLMAKMLKEEDV